MNVLAMGLLGANRLPRMTGNLRGAIGEPRCASMRAANMANLMRPKGPGMMPRLSGSPVRARNK